MQAFLFGDSAQPLYGVVHEPTGGQYRHSAILIAQPIAHEYYRTHRMVVQLANRLAAQGYYVLRFDYRGMADSQGLFEQATLSGWLHDIELAREELMSVSGCSVVDAVGLRLGAGMLLHPSLSERWSRLYLWDPLLSGATYVQSIAQLSLDTLTSTWWHSLVRKASERADREYLGYLYSAELIRELESFEIDVSTLKPHLQIEWLTTGEDDDSERYYAAMKNQGLDIHKTPTEDMGDWYALKKITSSITTPTILSTIEQALAT